ncbi:MAG: YczE/YyaS/YitT family protein [Candidatus Alkaliphilus sp. MAG34]|nr:membrane protein [Clostridiales bacterium]
MKLNKKLFTGDVKKVPGLILAFAICGYGTIQIKVANLGMEPWDTLALGINSRTGIDFGKVTQIVGLVIILFSLAIRIYPGMATILNMFFIGFFADVTSKFNIVLIPQHYLLRIIVLFYGNIILSYGLYSYLKFELGAGPRDGLMVGLVKATGLDVKYIKTGMELIVLVVGYLLGGTIGIGTIISTFSGGYMLDRIFRWKGFNAKETCQRKLTDYLVRDKEETAVEDGE